MGLILVFRESVQKHAKRKNKIPILLCNDITKKHIVHDSNRMVLNSQLTANKEPVNHQSGEEL